jgi:hypothetical protein
MADRTGRGYSSYEREHFVPPPCPRCGNREITVHWEESTAPGSAERTWSPAMYFCRTCNGPD